MFTEESLLVRKRLRKDHQNSSGPVPSFTQGPNGATYPGTIRAPSPGNARQAMNPIIVNEGSHYPVRVSNSSFLYLLRPLLSLGITSYQFRELYSQARRDLLCPCRII